MSVVADKVFQLVAPIAESFGLELVEVEFKKEYDGMNLTVYIDKDGGVSIDDCEKLHRAIDEPLDQLDPIAENYILNVSSLGLDRPLKTERDFKKNLGKEISVKLYQAVDKKKLFSGILLEFDEKSFSIEVVKQDKTEKITFLKEKVAHIEPVIRF